MDKLPRDMMEAIEKTDLDDKARQLLTDVLYAERLRKEQSWDNSAVDMLDKYLTAEQGASDGINF